MMLGTLVAPCQLGVEGGDIPARTHLGNSVTAVLRSAVMLTSNMGRKKCDPTPSSEAGLSPFIQLQELPRTPAPGIHTLPAPVSASSKAKGTSPPTEVLEQRGLGKEG